jgi:hypothetical protein
VLARVSGVGGASAPPLRSRIFAALPPSRRPTTLLKVRPAHVVRLHAPLGGKQLSRVLPRRERLADGSCG